MDLTGLLIFLGIGAVAGWLAGLLLKGGGFGLIGNIVIGILGSVVGGYAFGLLGLSAYGLIGSIVMATAAAVLLLVIIGVVKKAASPSLALAPSRLSNQGGRYQPTPNRSSSICTVVARPSSPIADRRRQRDLFGADPHAVLGVPAVGQPARAHDGVQPRDRVVTTGGMGVHQTDLGQRGGTQELAVRTELRTGRHAASAAHAAAIEIIRRPLAWRDSRGAGVQVPGAVDADPGAHLPQAAIDARAVDQ